MKILVAIGVAAVAVASLVPAAVAAKPKPPTKAQKAEARAIVAAVRKLDAAVMAQVGDLNGVAGGCEATIAVGDIESLPEEQALLVIETFVELALAQLAQTAGPVYRQHAGLLAKLKLKDATLRAGRNGLVHQANALGAVPPTPAVDTCTALGEWKANAFTAETKPSSGVALDFLESPQWIAADKAIARMAQRLVAFGISKKVVEELF